MAELNCRIVALFTLAISLIYLGSAVFFRHLGHHNSDNRHYASESLTVEHEIQEAIEPIPPALPSSTEQPEVPHDWMVSESCLQCICNVTTECKPAKCNNNSFMCGIFKISMAYWQDGGKPTLDGAEATSVEEEYFECVNNPFCAFRTVENYMRRYKRDCNKDGTIDCYDYATIHILGPSGCLTSELSSVTYTQLHQCIQRFSFNKPPDMR